MHALILWLPPLTLLLLLNIKLVLSKKRSSVRLPPSPWKLPFIGNLHQLGSLPHRSLDKLAKKHGPLMLLKLGQVPTLVVSSSQMAREIMKTHDHIFASRPHLKAAHIILYGRMDMAFAPYGEYWRQMRKIAVTNLLSMRRVQSFQAVREMEVAHLMDKISLASSSSLKALNMSHLLFCFSNNLLCRTILGDFSKQEGMNELFLEMIEEAMALLSGFNLEDYFPSLGWLSSLLGLDERAKRNFVKWDGVLSKMIQEHTNKKNRSNQQNDAFVDVLLSLKEDPNLGINLTNEQIKALLVDMFAAGTDTSYIVLEWGMAELIRNPNIMKKLQDEVKGIAYGKSMVNEHDLGEMHYLKAVIKEILRLHPPGPLLLPRESIDSCQLEGYEIPNKTRVIINWWAIATDPKVWEKPNEFIPERFLDNPIDFKGQNYEYIPFGSGRRICPGMHFGVSTVELTLANLVYRFDWLLSNALIGEVNMTETFGVTMKMKNNLHLVPKPCF